MKSKKRSQPGRGDRSHELAVVAVELVGVEHAGGHARDVARMKDPALAVGPDLDRATHAEEVVVLVLVAVHRDRPSGRADRGHHRHRAGGLLGPGQRTTDLPEQQVRTTVAVGEVVGHGLARQLTHWGGRMDLVGHGSPQPSSSGFVPGIVYTYVKCVQSTLGLMSRSSFAADPCRTRQTATLVGRRVHISIPTMLMYRGTIGGRTLAT